MPSFPSTHGPSFLPEDYLQRKAERRATFLGVSLFCIVMFSVVAAFFVTNRQWSSVKAIQNDINRDYAQEAKKIEQLKVLESQKTEMLDKAEITTALLEKVPRSILLAEVINRMPDQLTLTDLKLVSKRLKETPAEKTDPKGKNAPKSLASKSSKKPKGKSDPKKPAVAAGGKGAAGGNDDGEKPKPVPLKMEFTLELVGLARSDREVADYHASLKECKLLERVDLAYSTATTIDDVGMRKFRIEAAIRPAADARRIEPLHVPRLNPLPGLTRTDLVPPPAGVSADPNDPYETPSIEESAAVEPE